MIISFICIAVYRFLGLHRRPKMAKLVLLAILLVISLYPIYYIFLQSPPPLPDIELDAWWGTQVVEGDTESVIEPFKVSFRDESILNLKERLKKPRPYTASLEGTAFNYGFNSKVLQEFLEYWATEYNFDKREKYLNQYPQFKTKIQGLDIHFVRVTPKAQPGVVTVPILLLHGWPGSHLEFFEAIPYLTAYAKNRDFVLELIIPSLPGFGYSSAAARPGLGANEVAVVFRNLMHRLGFNQFYVQGGDFGAIIGSAMATLFPRDILGFHTNIAFSFSTRATILDLLGSLVPSLVVDSALADRMYPLSDRFEHILQETGYFHIQSTKPDTIGVALTDSHAGLLAYILEKFSTWTDKSNRDKADGGLTRFSKEHLIDNIMVYWTGRCITTSMRLYSETFNSRHFGAKIEEIPTSVPTWALQAKHELVYQPPWILRLKYHSLVGVTVLEEGGHFIAMEMPQVFARDVIKAMSAFRNLGQSKTEL